jgi:hypothetical protein
MAAIEEHVCCELKMMAWYKMDLTLEQFEAEKHIAA